LATGNPKASVPWTAINNDQGAFIDPEYLPDVLIREPTKLNRSEVKDLLNHWYDRAAEKERPFKFSGILAPSGSTGKAGSSKESDRPKIDKSKSITTTVNMAEPVMKIGPPRGQKKSKDHGSRLSTIPEEGRNKDEGSDGRQYQSMSTPLMVAGSSKHTVVGDTQKRSAKKRSVEGELARYQMI
jgi:hypothetical protein